MIAATITGCKKYPDGPSFSLHTKTNRLCHKWKLVAEFDNGQQSATTAEITYEFKINHTYDAVESGTRFSGQWQFSSDSKSVLFDGSFGYTILRLESKSLWLEVNSHEAHYELY